MASAPKNTNVSGNVQDSEKPRSQENDGNRGKKRCRQNLRRRKWKNQNSRKRKAEEQKGSSGAENIAQSERNENIDEPKRNTGEEGSPGENQQSHKAPERVLKKPKIISVHVESLRRSEAGLWAGFGHDCLLVYTHRHRVRKLLVEERAADGRMEQAWSTKIQIKLHGSVKPHPPRSTSDKEIRPTSRQRKAMRLSRPAPPPSIQAVCCLPDSRVVVRDAAATHFYTSDMTWRLRWFRGDYGHLVAVLDSALVYCSQQEAEETRPPACRLQLFSDSKHNLIRTLPWRVSSERVSICRHPHSGMIALVDQDDKSLHIYRSLHCTDPEIRIPLRFAPILSNAVAAVDDFIIVAEQKSLHVFTWEGEKVGRWGNGMKETGEWMRRDGDVKKEDGDVKKEDGDVKKGDGDIKKEDNDTKKEHVDEMKEHGNAKKGNGDAKKGDGDEKKGDRDIRKKDGDINKGNSDEMKHGDVKKEDGDIKKEDNDTKKECGYEMEEHGNAKKGNGDAKEGDGDVKMGDCDEKKEDDDIKKEDGDIGKEDCDKKKEGDTKKGDCDEKEGGDIKVDGDIEKEDGDIKMEEDGENNGDRDDGKVDLVKTKGNANKDEGKEEVHGKGAENDGEEEVKSEEANVEQERNTDEASGNNGGGNRKRRDIFENFYESRASSDLIPGQYDRLDNALGMASPWHVVQGIGAVGGRLVLVEGDGPVSTEIRRIHLYEVRPGEEERAGCDVVKTGEMFEEILRVV